LVLAVAMLETCGCAATILGKDFGKGIANAVVQGIVDGLSGLICRVTVEYTRKSFLRRERYVFEYEKRMGKNYTYDNARYRKFGKDEMLLAEKTYRNTERWDVIFETGIFDDKDVDKNLIKKLRTKVDRQTNTFYNIIVK